jgi:hypothetical protein
MLHFRTFARLAAPAALVVALACDDNGTGPVAQAGMQSTASLLSRTFTQRERLGNPLVSEVMVRKALHQAYNAGQPSTDVAAWSQTIKDFVTGVAGRQDATAATIAAVLLPDMLVTYPKRDGTPVFWLSWAFGGYGGRTLPDDVVDTGLAAIFGSLLDPNNVSPGLATDNVSSNDVPFQGTFPYVAAAH